MFSAWKSFWKIVDVACTGSEKIITNLIGVGVNASDNLLKASIAEQKKMAED